MAFGGTLGPHDLMPQPLRPELSRALEGAIFPLTRSELSRVARENEAPDTLLTLLEGLPEQSYLALDSVERALERSPFEGAADNSVESPLDHR